MRIGKHAHEHGGGSEDRVPRGEGLLPKQYDRMRKGNMSGDKDIENALEYAKSVIEAPSRSMAKRLACVHETALSRALLACHEQADLLRAEVSAMDLNLIAKTDEIGALIEEVERLRAAIEAKDEALLAIYDYQWNPAIDNPTMRHEEIGDMLQKALSLTPTHGKRRELERAVIEAAKNLHADYDSRWCLAGNKLADALEALAALDAHAGKGDE